MRPVVLALNAGSSSLKFALYETTGARPDMLCHGVLESISSAPHFHVRDAAGACIGEERWKDGFSMTHEALLGFLLDWIAAHGGGTALRGVGHRIVHGGGVFTQPVMLTPEIVELLAGFTPLAPLHQPHSLAPVGTIAALRPELPQIGCFDTAFHATLPHLATAFPLPRRYADAGVRRYGFHGLSYEYIAGALPEVAPEIARKRVVVAHLGNGASLCALRDGKSIDTTTGFTALDGLMMGTRCGSLDPGVILYMMREEKLPPEEIEHILYQHAGLLGVSGISADVRTLLASADPHAAEAIDLFVFRIVRETAAMAASLGGLDGFVFTAGIGEHAAEIRAKVAAGLAWMGVRLGAAIDLAGGAQRLSSAQSTVQVYMIPTNEEEMLVRHVLDILDAPHAAADEGGLACS